MAVNTMFRFAGLEPKKLCVLIAPPARKDREMSVNGEAKMMSSGVLLSLL